jgi:hypothetical protein
VQAAPATAAVAPPPPDAAGTPPPAHVSTSKTTKPSPMVAAAPPPPEPAPAPVVRNTPAPPPAPVLPPAPVAAKTPPSAPVPVIHTVTLPIGTAIPVRMTQTLDSGKTQTGDKFTGEIASDLIDDGVVVLPQGTPVTGHVDAAQDAAHYKGSSLLTLSLIAIDRKGERIEVSKNTAEKVGGGAAIGAILGGILGGGKGAAIGAAAGGGAGAGANSVTRGQQVQIPSETVVRFRLLDPLQVRLNPAGAAPDNSSSSLPHHD